MIITLTGSGIEQPVFGHLIINVGAYAKGTIVLEHQGSATFASSVSVLVGDGAQVEFVGLQLWADDTVHAGQVALKVGRDAQVRTLAATLGGDLVRLVETVEYAGPGGSSEQFGLYFADAGQHLEHRLFVDHNAPHTKSNVDYRGALQGRGAHSVWVGDVLIRKIAEGIETYESNKNLVLTDGCRADSVPNLEIETGEIAGAGHASTTGRFDDEQLFYLRSRGIDEAEARRLVVHGFFADIIRRVGVPVHRAAVDGRRRGRARRERRAARAMSGSAPDDAAPSLRARRGGAGVGHPGRGRRHRDRHRAIGRCLLRDRRRVLARRHSAVRRGCRRRRDRVLPARVALRSSDRRAARAPGHRARGRLPLRGRRRRCARRHPRPLQLSEIQES